MCYRWSHTQYIHTHPHLPHVADGLIHSTHTLMCCRWSCTQYTHTPTLTSFRWSHTQYTRTHPHHVLQMVSYTVHAHTHPLTTHPLTTCCRWSRIQYKHTHSHLPRVADGLVHSTRTHTPTYHVLQMVSYTGTVRSRLLLRISTLKMSTFFSSSTSPFLPFSEFSSRTRAAFDFFGGIIVKAVY